MGANRAVNPDDPSVNAHSTEVTIAEGSNTHGRVNQHPASSASPAPAHVGGLQEAAGTDGLIPFRVGMSEDRNKRWRRTMEDSHAFVYDFGGVQGQGFFSVFDGHAGKHSAEWCGKHFHEYLLKSLEEQPDQSVPDILNETFHRVDQALSQLAQTQGSSSGCTAVTAFLRLEDEEGTPVTGPKTGGIVKNGSTGSAFIGGAAAGDVPSSSSASGTAAAPSSDGGTAEGSAAEKTDGMPSSSDGSLSAGLFSAFSRKARQLSGSSSGSPSKSTSVDDVPKKAELASNTSGLITVTGKEIRRVLYTANVGDARAVLCRGGKAIRLTYDHKGSDAQEAKRITDAGGFVMNNRVNGVLAVTRSLGDSSMKEFVVGAPYTTETALTEEDTLLIVACDGLWDVVDDQDAVDLIQDVEDPQEASGILLQHALSNFSTDNTSVMVVRFAVKPNSITDPPSGPGATETAVGNDS